MNDDEDTLKVGDPFECYECPPGSPDRTIVAISEGDESTEATLSCGHLVDWE